MSRFENARLLYENTNILYLYVVLYVLMLHLGFVSAPSSMTVISDLCLLRILFPLATCVLKQSVASTLLYCWKAM